MINIKLITGFIIGIWLLSSMVLVSCTQASTHTAEQSKMIASIDEVMSMSYERGLFNGNVLVMKNGKPLYEESFGFSEGAKSRELDKNGVFNVGSIAKEFNAVGIMMLSERGQLSLEDSVFQYLPTLPSWAETIKIKHLLNYTSGLPVVNWADLKTQDDTFQDLMKITALAFSPGEGYIYSNNNVFLQRLIIEKVSGQSFEKFTIENILKPSGMTRAVTDPDNKYDGLVEAFNNKFVPDPSYDFPIKGWVYLTATDMWKWLGALHCEKLVANASLKTLFNSYSQNELGALGFGKYSDGTLSYHQHHGSSFNFEALVTYNVRDDLAIILMTNSKARKLQDITLAIEAIDKGELYNIPRKSMLMALKAYCQESVETCLTGYEDLKKKEPDLYDFDNENGLNQIGYTYIGQEQYVWAIQIFKLLVSEFPNAANPYDSLGEAYFLNENYTKALESYNQALTLNPTSKNAQDMVKKITMRMK